MTTAIPTTVERVLEVTDLVCECQTDSFDHKAGHCDGTPALRCTCGKFVCRNCYFTDRGKVRCFDCEG